MVSPRTVVPVVIDCSILIKWELQDEDYTDEALELLQDWRAGVVEFHAPDLLPSEIGSAFLRALRRGRVTAGQARASIQGLLAVAYSLWSSELLLERAFEIAEQHNQRIYDCFYVALAEQAGIEFWTGDERLANALGVHFPFIRRIADHLPRR
jgi:predicted nucleic acid-binding protein